MKEKVCVGSIAGSFGVRGEVRLKSYCAEPEAIETYGELTSEDGTLVTTVGLISTTKNSFTARLSAVTTKEQADALKGTKLYADRSQLPDLPDDEYYYSDLIGLEVLDTGGNRLGKVKAVLNHGASDLLELHAGGETVLIPFTKGVVPTVDLASGRLIADPPEGLF